MQELNEVIILKSHISLAVNKPILLLDQITEIPVSCFLTDFLAPVVVPLLHICFSFFVFITLLYIYAKLK